MTKGDDMSSHSKTDTRRVLLITGASAGIGAATAQRAAQEGYDLVLGYKSDTAGVNAVAATCRHSGARVVTHAADVADPAAIDTLFAAIDAEFGRLDACVNNAGIVDAPTAATDLTFDRLRRMFDINVIGAMLVAGAAARRMITQGGGAIVNVSSVAARLGSPFEYVDYAASKAAMDTFSRGLALELADQNIRVNTLRPGTVNTGIHAKGGQPDRARRVAPSIPMKRVGEPAEIADVILFLLSDKASYITGETLDVSGGR